jgi:hypothetical protein
MFNFAGITHVIHNPSGHASGYNYSLVGSVPGSMLDWRKATMADIMGGRDHNGLAPHGKRWETVEAILAEAAQHPEVKLCSSASCACRRFFQAVAK